MYQIIHDLLRETFCCTDRNYSDHEIANLDNSSMLIEDMNPKS